MSSEKKKEDGAATKRGVTVIKEYLQEAADLWGRLEQEAEKQGLVQPSHYSYTDGLGIAQWRGERAVDLALEHGSFDWLVDVDYGRTCQIFSDDEIAKCVAFIKEKLAQEPWSDD